MCQENVDLDWFFGHVRAFGPLLASLAPNIALPDTFVVKISASELRALSFAIWRDVEQHL
jgi:hypothetical protein